MTAGSMTAVERVAQVRDDPEGRYRLRVDFYRKYGSRTDRRVRLQRAA
ncbi:MAG: hypothetical protein ACREF4_22110 [Gammaproteobacteria bacterium]